MTAPAFKAIGTRVSGNASSGITATSPVLAVGDICLAFVQAVNGNPATPSGWTLCAGCPTSTAAPFYNVYWQRASSAGTLSFSATQSGFVTAVIAAYSGCVTNGDPTEAGAGQQNDSSTTVNIPAITTLGADRLVVLSGFAGATPQSSIVNATLSGLATRESVEPQMGDGSLASAGSSGASSFTVGSAVPSAAHAIALIPTATSGNTAAASSSLGSLASSASATLAMAAAVSCGLGALSCGAAVTQSQAATAQPQLGALETSTSASQAQAATAASTLGALATAITVQQVNVNTATIVATLGPLSSGAVLTQSQAAAGASALSPLSASGNATQAQQAAAGSALPNFWCDASALASNQAQVEATLGPLFTAITATAQPTYIGDGRYYVALPVRPFYASLPPRSFYAQLPARSFYIMSDPNMTPTFEDKDPREDVVLTFDASADLATGETLTGTPTVQVTVLKGTDAGAQNIVGAPVINTQAVSVKLRNGSTVTVPANQGVQVPALNGLDACEYLIAVTCSTSNPAKKLTMKSVLPVTAY